MQMQVEGSFPAEELTVLMLIDLSLTRVCLYIYFFSWGRWAFPIECGMCLLVPLPWGLSF